MRNLILVLIAFIAIVTFIKAYDGNDLNPAESSTRTIQSSAP